MTLEYCECTAIAKKANKYKNNDNTLNEGGTKDQVKGTIHCVKLTLNGTAQQVTTNQLRNKTLINISNDIKFNQFTKKFAGKMVPFNESHISFLHISNLVVKQSTDPITHFPHHSNQVNFVGLCLH